MLNLVSKSVVASVGSKRLFSSAACVYGGNVGAGSEAFNKKEKAEEDYYVRQREQEQLSQLKESLAKIKEQTADLESKIGKIEKK